MGDSCRRRKILCIVTGVLLNPGVAVADDLQAQIDACADVADDDIRLACFDALASGSERATASAGNRPMPAPAARSATEASPPTGAGANTEAKTQSPPISAPPPARDDAREMNVYNLRLTRCTQTSVSGRQVYYLDNGEVWRQSNSSRNNVQNCDTAVTIEKDLFGFKMHVPSENRSVRISPVR